MLDLNQRTILYHGSFCEVSSPDLSKCAKYKDFGQGFYLTTDKEQAKSFAKISTRKAQESGVIPTQQNFGVVSSFEYIPANLRTQIFSTADADWLHCIVAHRKKGLFNSLVQDFEKYDIVGGKIANDATNITITTYMTGTFGDVGSQQADEICIRLLLPERLKDQYCFRTAAALQQLAFIKSERIWL